MKRSVLSLVCALLVSFLLFPSPHLFAAPPYYQGKVVRIVVGFSPGGGYDRMARLLAKYLPKYIPGNPTIIVENMGGASSIIGANYLYNIAKPDGLTIGTFNRALHFAHVIKLDGIKFDMLKYSWIGSTAVESTVCAIRSELPYKTAAEFIKAKDAIAMGCSGSGTSDFQFSTLLKEFLGVNMKMIIYPSSSECMLGLERKEVDGRSGSFSSLKPTIERGLIRPIIRGRISEPGIENLPVNEDLTKDKMGKLVMAMFSSADLVGRPYVAPPGTPASTSKILRDAFAKVCKDPGLVGEAKKLLMQVKYVPAEEVMGVIKGVYNEPEDVKKAFAKYVTF
jgi:tripartite-type tricarboxylate transporter receptor subunit TctC